MMICADQELTGQVEQSAQMQPSMEAVRTRTQLAVVRERESRLTLLT
jgi:hypothetical protein